MDVHVKQEPFEPANPRNATTTTRAEHDASVIELSSSDSEDDVIDAIESIIRGSVSKKQKLENSDVVMPVGFLDPLTPMEEPSPSTLLRRSTVADTEAIVTAGGRNSKQFWKAGDCFEGATSTGWDSSTVGMDHIRVHPKFLHSNATSHKWALGAFAELLDNALDEIYSGATYVNIDVLQNKKDANKMLLIEDNGGGMDPDKMRQCMSLGYSAKSKIANTIGQYGNGFKTSTMRLGADVIVFSRSCGEGGKSSTQSIGLLSYTFLRSTGKEDIVVPMLDYERGVGGWNKMTRLAPDDWNKNVQTIVHWSPFSNEVDLLRQFNMMKDHGTRIIIYNLWEDDQGMLELDLDTEKHDILLRGANRDEKNIEMANEFPNSRHFLTYRHSLRSYASILYLRLLSGFRIILRGKDVMHHNSVNDMMLTQEVTYRPQPGSDGVPKDTDMLAVVNIGFVKDAKHHIDVQGFNVYHKNRLIKPFWRLWNSAGSDGRGVIGVLEANFVEPAHDKQGFERTPVLARLEAKLIQMQKTYWRTYCHKIGYAPRNNKNDLYREPSPDFIPPTSSTDKNRAKRKPGENCGKFSQSLNGKYGKGHMPRKNTNELKSPRKRSEISSPSSDDNGNEEILVSHPERQVNGSNQKTSMVGNSYDKKSTSKNQSSFNMENTEARQGGESSGMHIQTLRSSLSKADDSNRYENNSSNSNSYTMDQLRKQNRELTERLKKKEYEISNVLIPDLQHEKERCKLLKAQLEEAQQKLEDLNREQESLIDIFSEERDRRDVEEENLRKKLKAASDTIQELQNKARK